jgi:hypothetical protein
MGFKGRNGREKTEGEINREMWNRLNSVYELGGSIAGPLTFEKRIGIHTEDEELRKEWASMGGKVSIERLLQWQLDNDFRVCDLERTDEWCNNISIALTGRTLSKSVRDKISKTLKDRMASMTPEERREKFGNQSMLGKNHKDESKEKMRENANQRVAKLGENYISKERKEKMREENGERVVVYFFNSNNRDNKGDICYLFLSGRQAQNYFKSGSIQHVLKNRAKRFGADKNKDGFQGYFAEFVSAKKYEELCKLYPITIK